MGSLTEVTICDMALTRLGSRRLAGDADGTLANCTDTSYEKELLGLWYPRCRDRVLEGFPWTFARGFATLALADDGDGEVWEDEWDLAYSLPADCLTVRRFVSDVGRWGFYFSEDTPMGCWQWLGREAWRYVLRLHDGARVILTDVKEADADIEYTVAVTDASLFTEAFGSALAWGLAAELGTSLSVAPGKRQEAMQHYLHELRIAGAHLLNEENDQDQEDGPFMRARWGP